MGSAAGAHCSCSSAVVCTDEVNIGDRDHRLPMRVRSTCKSLHALLPGQLPAFLPEKGFLRVQAYSKMLVNYNFLCDNVTSEILYYSVSYR